MPKAKLKTAANDASVDAFLARVTPERRRADALELNALMKSVTREPPCMWGPSIVGFGRYAYRYESGREGEMPLVGFSPRKQALVLYIMPGFEAFDRLLARLGKHTTGKSCLYVKTLDDVDRTVLRELVRQSYRHMKASGRAARRT